MRSALAVANALLNHAAVNGTALSSDALHSLTYFAHGLRLALVNDVLLDEVVMARRDGIFIEGLASAGAVGTRNIKGQLTQVERLPNGLLSEKTPVLDAADPACATLELVWSRFGRFSDYDLGLFARSAGSPWDEIWNNPERLASKLSTVAKQAWQEDDAIEGALVIPNSLIRRWFRSLVIQEKKEQASAEGLEETIHAMSDRLEKTVRISVEKKLRSA
ncbi:MAG: hypothetical protein Q7J29_09020 [Stagnimonas sp.]|nr:hypothetical protein [Stagnimonas sp.]